MNQFGGIPNMPPNLQPQPSSQNHIDAFKQKVFEFVRSQPPPQGWQVSLSPQIRAGYIWQIFSQLRLLANSSMNQPQAEQRALFVACQFERGAFANAQNRQQYEDSINGKMADLGNKRQQNANSAVSSGNAFPQPPPAQPAVHAKPPQTFNGDLTNPQFAMGRQPSQSQLFGGQMPQAGSMNFVPNMMQQSQPQPQPQLQPGQPPFQRPQGMNPQSVNPQGNVPNRMPSIMMDDPRVISASQKMAQRYRQGGRWPQLEQSVVNMFSPQQLQSMRAAGQDPVDFMLRRQAVTMLQKQQQSQQQQLQQPSQQSQQPQQTQQPSKQQQPQPQPSQQARQVNINGMPAAGTPQVPPNTQQMRGPQNQNRPGVPQQTPNMRTPFGAPSQPTGPDIDLSRFIGQQEDAQRSQAAGDDVVPASNNPSMNQAVNTSFNPLAQFGGMNNGFQSGNMMNGQQTPNFPAGQPSQQQSQAPANAQNLSQNRLNPGATPMSRQGNMSLHGQVGGLQGQPSPAMRTLTQPFAAPGHQNEPSTTQPNNSRPASQVGGRNAPGPQQPTPQQAQVISFYRQLPAQMQARLQAMPPNERQTMIMRLIQNQNQNRANAAASGLGVPPQTTQPPQGPGIPQDFQLFNQPGQQPLTQADPSMSSQLSQMANQQNPSQPMPLTDVKNPDDLRLPYPMIDKFVENLNIPRNLQTWGQLKLWLRQNPKRVDQQKFQALMHLQRMHYKNLVENSNQQAGKGPNGPLQPPNSSAPAVSSLPTTQPQPHSQPQQQPQPQPQPQVPNFPIMQPTLQQQPQNQSQSAQSNYGELERRGLIVLQNGIPQIRPPTMQDVQQFRLRAGQKANGMPDKQLANLLVNDRMHQITSLDRQVGEQIKANMMRMRMQQQQHQAQQQQHQQQMLQQQQQHQNQLQQQPQPQPAMPFSAQPQPMPGMPNQLPRQMIPPNGLMGAGGQPTPKPFVQGMQQPPPGMMMNQMMPNASNPAMTRQGPPGPMNMPPVAPEVLARLQAEQQQRQAEAMKQNQQNNMPQKPQGLPPQAGTNSKPVSFDQIDGEFKNRVKTRMPVPNIPANQVIQQMKPRVLALNAMFMRDIAPSLRSAWETLAQGSDDNLTAFLKHTIEASNLLQHQIQQERSNPQVIYITMPDLVKMNWLFEKFRNEITVLLQKRSGAIANVPAPPTQPAVVDNKQVTPKQEPSAVPKRSPKRPADGDIKPPPAPTVAQAPYTFSPHGTPVYAQEKPEFPLRMPINKRPKKNPSISSASTPLQQPTPGPSSSPQPAAVVQKTAPAHPPPKEEQRPVVDFEFKCRFEDCEYHLPGFEVESDRAAHEKDVHKYTGNALDFCLVNMREALGIGATTPAREKDRRPMKREEQSRPSTPASRPATASGATSLLKAAQEGVKNALAKQGSPLAMKRTPSALGKSQEKPTPVKESKEEDDPWAASILSDGEINSIFGDIEGYGSYLKPDGFSLLTPPESDTSPTVAQAGKPPTQAELDKEHKDLISWNPFPDLFDDDDDIFAIPPTPSLQLNGLEGNFGEEREWAELDAKDQMSSGYWASGEHFFDTHPSLHKPLEVKLDGPVGAAQD